MSSKKIAQIETPNSAWKFLFLHLYTSTGYYQTLNLQQAILKWLTWEHKRYARKLSLESLTCHLQWMFFNRFVTTRFCGKQGQASSLIRRLVLLWLWPFLFWSNFNLQKNCKNITKKFSQILQSLTFTTFALSLCVSARTCIHTHTLFPWILWR